MKKRFFSILIAALFGCTMVMAQDGQRMNPEERTKVAMEKLAVLNLDADAKSKTEAAIAEYYTSAQKAMQDMRASGAGRDSMMSKRRELADARDAKLKTIFTSDQMKKWTDEIEPTLRPQRGGNRTQ